MTTNEVYEVSEGSIHGYYGNDKTIEELDQSMRGYHRDHQTIEVLTQSTVWLVRLRL